MTRKQTSRDPDEAKFTSYGRLEAVVFLVLALAGCCFAGMMLVGWSNRPGSPAAWLGRCTAQAIGAAMGVAAALAYSALARTRLGYGRQVVTTDSSALTFTQDGLQKVVPWQQVQEYRAGLYQDMLVGAGERIALASGGPRLRAIVQRHLPRGAKLTYLPSWYQWLGIEPPASAGRSTIWPNQATFRYSAGLIAGYLGASLALLGYAGVWIHRAASLAGVGPEFISEVMPTIAVSAVVAAFSAILALVMARGGINLLRHWREAVETDDHGISLIRGGDRLTISWHEVQRFEVTRYYCRIMTADRMMLIAVPTFCGNPELQRIIERNLPPAATYRHRHARWRTLIP